MAKVSVGVPIRNSVQFLSKSFELLAQQSHTDLEIIISDNNSIDNSWEICLEVANRDSRVHAIRQSRDIGMRRNFEFVLNQATSEYFVWWADDDWHDTRFLEKCVERLEANPKAGLAFSYFYIFYHPSGQRSGIKKPASTRAVDRYGSLLCRINEPLPGVIYGLFRRELLLRSWPMHRSFDGMELETLNRISLLADVEIVEEVLYGAGIKTAVYVPKPTNGSTISMWPYVKRTLLLVLRELPITSSMRLVPILFKRGFERQRYVRAVERAYRDSVTENSNNSAR
jgi:glycosyltransferase involved in cell wall biosynthesis